MMDNGYKPRQAAVTLRKVADALLLKNDIHKLTTHGWVGPNDTDPNEIGHAMWQLDDPADEVLAREWHDTKPVKLPEWKTFCSVAGADFEGLMNGARLAIGYALFQIHELGERLEDEDSLGAMYSRSAIMSLGAASDRIRDYFVAGIFRVPPTSYVNSVGEGISKKKRSMYSGPFNEAAACIEGNDKLSERFIALTRLAVEVQKFREKRNFVVHQIATELGRMRMRVIESAAQGTIDTEGWEKLTEADLFHVAEQQRKQASTLIHEALDDPIAWYKLLIQFAECVFF